MVLANTQPKREPRPKKPRVERPASDAAAGGAGGAGGRGVYADDGDDFEDEVDLTMEDDAADEDFDLEMEVGGCGVLRGPAGVRVWWLTEHRLSLVGRQEQTELKGWFFSAR